MHGHYDNGCRSQRLLEQVKTGSAGQTTVAPVRCGLQTEATAVPVPILDVNRQLEDRRAKLLRYIFSVRADRMDGIRQFLLRYAEFSGPVAKFIGLAQVDAIMTAGFFLRFLIYRDCHGRGLPFDCRKHNQIRPFKFPKPTHHSTFFLDDGSGRANIVIG